MSAAAGAMNPAPLAQSPTSTRKASNGTAPDAAKEKEKRYKCQFCNRAFSRSEHRSRHERSHTKERPFKCMKCRSTFVRRDLLLRHDRTVHAKDGGVPLQSDSKRRNTGTKAEPAETPAKLPELDDASLEQFGDSSELFGVEQAAMLMANFQQKAAMSGQDVSSITAEPLISPHGPQMMEPSLPYPGSMTLPQMHGWDQMLPQTVSQPKASSITSNGITSNGDPTHDLLGFSTGVASSNTLPPLMDRQQGQSNDGLPSFASSSMMGGMGTPGALSPFPSMMGPVSPVDYRRSPGPPQQCTMAKAPQVETEDQISRIMDNIRHCDSEGALIDTFRLPVLSVLNRYLSTYFNFYHHHLPFVHPASFDPAKVSAPLLLSILSIGALYTFEQDQAYMLHIGSKVLVTQFLQKKDNFSSRKLSLIHI